MRCAYHPDREAVLQCSQCQKPLCDQCAFSKSGSRVLCSRCSALIAAEDVLVDIRQRRENKTTRKHEDQERKKRKGKMLLALQLLALMAALVVIIVLAPRIAADLKGSKPIRSGTYATNKNTDQCINNLWRISRLLQEGKTSGDAIVCPESGRPYSLVEREGDIVVYCANPELHGFRELRVSRKYPRPEIVK